MDSHGDLKHGQLGLESSVSDVFLRSYKMLVPCDTCQYRRASLLITPAVSWGLSAV